MEKAQSMLRNEEIRQNQEKASSSRNLALNASSNTDAAKKKKEKTKKEREAARAAKKGLNCTFCDIKDSHTEENCWKKHPEKTKKKDSKEEEKKAYTAISNKAYTAIDSSDSWIIDSGATQHLTYDYDQLYDYKAYARPESTGGITGQIDIYGEGKVDLRCIGPNDTVRTVSVSCTHTHTFTQENGRTLLSWAAGSGRIKPTKILLATEDFDPNSKDKYSQTVYSELKSISSEKSSSY